MQREKSRVDFYKSVCVSLALMLVIIISNFPIGASTISPQQSSPADKAPSFLEYVSLMNNSYSILFSGFLVDGLNQKPIANATINIVDSRNLTVYGQTKTNESGWFAFSFPLYDADLSIKAVFLGDSQHQGYSSDIENIILPELPWLAILPLLICMLLIAVKFRHRKPALLSKQYPNLP